MQFLNHTLGFRRCWLLNTFDWLISMLMQEIKKKNKCLQDAYEGLEYIQDTYRDQCVTEGMKKSLPMEQHFGLAQSLANVEEKCQKWADIIIQNKQVNKPTQQHILGKCLICDL